MIENVPNKYLTIRLRNKDVVTVSYGRIDEIKRDQVIYRKDHPAEKFTNYGSSLSLVIGNGFPDGYNFELGGRLSRLSTDHTFFGLTIVDYFGTDNEGFDIYGTNAIYHDNVAAFGVDVGYASVASNLAIIGYIEPGVQLVTLNPNEGQIGYPATSTFASFYFAPGVLFQWSFPSGLKCGIDAKYSFVSESDALHAGVFSLTAQLGFKL
jgi:hypothetical protein